jgi:hypothetical protein
MGIGTSIFLIAAGAIMRYAVHTHVDGFSIHTAGTIFMVVGAIGLAITLFWLMLATSREPRDEYVPRRDY